MRRHEPGNPMQKELHMRIKTLAFAAITAWMLSAIAMAQGVVYQGQFLPATGGNIQTSAGGWLSTAGSTWNSIRISPLSGSADLLTATGQSTTAKFVWTNWEGAFGGTVANTSFNGTVNANLMSGWAYFTVASAFRKSFEFQGLPAGTYTLYVFTQGDKVSGNRQLAMSINGGSAQGPITREFLNYFNWGNNLINFTSIVVGADGKITGTVWNNDLSTGTTVFWNGFQLETVSLTKTTPTITTAPTATAITFGQTLANSTLSGGVASVPGTFAFTTPTTAPSAGTASVGVTFTPTDTASYNAVATTVSVTVSKATPTITTSPTATGITFGQTLASSTLSGGVGSVAGTFAFTTPTTAPSAGTAAQSVTFTPTASGNYNTVATTVNVTVAKATPTITTAPTASGILSGQTLASSTLSGGVASVPGTFAFTTPSTAPGLGTASQGVTFTPTDTANYNTVATTASVTVSKATPTITTAPTATGITFGQTLASSTLSGGVASVAGTFAFTTPTTAPSGGTAAQSVTFTPTDTANYNTVATTVNVAVAKATPTITTAPTATGITFGQTLASSTLSGGAASVAGTFAFTTPTTAPSAGTAAQSVTFTPTASGNYNTVATTVNVTVAKATPTVTTAPTATGIAYGQTLASSTLSGGVASVPGTFAFTTPTTAPGAGTASQGVTFTPTDTANNNTVTLTVSVAVAKATPTITTAPTATGITFGQTLASSTLSGGVGSVAGTFAFTTPTTAPSGGTAAQGVTFTPTDTANYNTVALTVNVTVAKATPTVSTSPTASSITYGQTLASSTLSGGAASVAGTFAFTTPTTAPTAGTATQSVTFTPTASGNYNSVTVNVSVTVAKATPTITTAPTAAGIVFGQTLANATLSGGVASVPGTFAFTTPTTAPAVGTASQGVTFTPTDTANNNTVTTTVSVVVGKATPTITTAPTASGITFGQTLASSTLSGGVGSVAGTFAFTTPTTAPSGGMAAQSVTFTPTATASYNTVSLTVNVTVAKVTPTVTTSPTATGITFGQTLASSTLSGGVGSVSGTFAFTTPTTAPSAGTAAQSVTFTPTASGNYNAVTVNVNVTVAKATPTVTTAPTAAAIVYGQNLASATLSGGVASVPGAFGFTTPTTQPPLGTADQAVTFVATDAANYNTVSVTASVTVTKATPTITTVPTASTLNLGQTLAGSFLSGGVASAPWGGGTTNVAGTFAFTAPATKLPLGTNAQSVLFTPADASLYNPVSLTVSVGVAWAARGLSTGAMPPTRMTYQGYVTDGTGSPIGTNGAVVARMVFRIFDAVTGGNAVWAEQQALSVDQGYFSAQLGEGTAIAGVSNPPGGLADVFTGADASERYVGVTLLGFGAGGADIEVTPRVRLTAAPYAYLATAAVGLAGSSGASLLALSTNLVFAGTVTAPSLSTPVINVGNLTVTNSLNFSGLAGGFVSSTDGALRVLGGVHRWTNINNVLTLVTEPSRGYSITRTGVGTFRIVFDTPFSSPPMVVATQLAGIMPGSPVPLWCDVVQSSTTSVAVTEVTVRTLGMDYTSQTWLLWTTALNEPTSYQSIGMGNSVSPWNQYVGTYGGWSWPSTTLQPVDLDFSFVVMGN